jgi:hypothetical protein
VATIKYGHYKTMEEFIKGMNDALESEIGNKTDIYLTYNALTGKVTVHVKIVNCPLSWDSAEKR